MRVLQVIKDMDEGGAQVVVGHLVDELTAAGHEVAIAGMPGRLSPRFDVPQYGLPMTGANPRLLPAGMRALDVAIRDFRPDVVHAHNPGTMPITTATTVRGRRVPALVTLHGSPREQYRANARLAKVTGMPTVACGPAVAALMAEAGAPVTATVINGVSATSRRSRADVRADLGVGEGLVIVQVGRLSPVKNPDLAVEALAASGIDATLVFAGAGELADDVRATARRLGVDDRVRLLGPRSDAADIMAAADAVSLSSRSEGLPLVLLEAMTLGTPVVATQAPGITELVHDGRDGVLTPNSVEGLAAGYRQIADPQVRATVGEGGRRRSAEFTTKRMADDYVRLYESLTR